MKINMPYGQDWIRIELHEKNLLGVIQTNKIKIKDENKLILSSLESPVDSKPFEQFLEGADDILFLINDATRHTKTSTVLTIIWNLIKDKTLKFLIATGTHRAPTEKELKFIFGPHLEKIRDKIYIHDSKKYDDMDYYGKSSRGSEIYINKLFKKANKIVVIGSTEPHYFAGYTGGRKSIMPGIAGYKTIENNHKQALSDDSAILKLKGNPVHEDMMEILKIVTKNKEIFSIMMVVDNENNIYSVDSGNIVDSFLLSTKKANDVYCVKIKDKVDIIVTDSRYPMDLDFYQAHKAMENTKQVLKDGGIMIILAQCRDGIGQDNFFKLLCSGKEPKELLDKVNNEYKLGFHKVAKFISLVNKSQIWLVSDLDFDLFKKTFIKPYNDLQKAVDDAIELKGADSKILFVTEGNLVVPYIE